MHPHFTPAPPPAHLSNLDLEARRAAAARHRAATDANPYLRRTNERLAELRAAGTRFGGGRVG